MRRAATRWLGLALLAVGCATASDRPDTSTIPSWTSRAIPEARGDVRVEPDGRRVAVRYAGGPARDFGRFRTYAYDGTLPEPSVQRAAMPSGVAGDPVKGRVLFLDRA